MDNKPVEKLGESYIKSRLLKFQFDLHSDLSYDKNGADLIITQKLDVNKLHFIKIQCKSRRLKKSTNVHIPISYVNENFVLFVYLIDENQKESLFCLFDNDIKELFKKDESNYNFTFTSNKIENLSNRFSFDNQRAIILKSLFDKFKQKTFTSVIIDGIFLIEAVQDTLSFYSKYWNRELAKPKLKDIIRFLLLLYNRFDDYENDIACYVYISNHHYLEQHVTVERSNSFRFKNTSIKVFINYSDELVAFQVMDDINRFKHSDKIILVANDFIYEDFLRNLEGDVDDIIIMRLKIKERPNEMYVNYRWGDVSHPIGLSAGLKREEL